MTSKSNVGEPRFFAALACTSSHNGGAPAPAHALAAALGLTTVDSLAKPAALALSTSSSCGADIVVVISCCLEGALGGGAVAAGASAGASSRLFLSSASISSTSIWRVALAPPSRSAALFFGAQEIAQIVDLDLTRHLLFGLPI